MEEKKEILEYIKQNNLFDVFSFQNEFYNNYGVNLYLYLRISTKHQDFKRQILTAYEWAKKKNIKIDVNNIYCDQYTGKSLNRKSYRNMRELTKKGDFILYTELSRMGRNWDEIKKEWYTLKIQEINVLIMDNEQLSATLPTEIKETMTIDKKFIQELVFNGVLYVACKKIEEVSTATKNGLKSARLQGKIIGKPRTERTSFDNFKKTIQFIVENNTSQKNACKITNYSIDTFKKDISKIYKRYNTKNYKTILALLEKETQCLW